MLKITRLQKHVEHCSNIYGHDLKLVDSYSKAKRLYRGEPNFSGWMLKCERCPFWYIEEDLEEVSQAIS